MISHLFLPCETFFLFLIGIGDVAARGASDRAIKTRPLIFTYWGGGGGVIDIMWPISQSHFHVSCLCSLK